MNKIPVSIKTMEDKLSLLTRTRRLNAGIAPLLTWGLKEVPLIATVPAKTTAVNFQFPILKRASPSPGQILRGNNRRIPPLNIGNWVLNQTMEGRPLCGGSLTADQRVGRCGCGRVVQFYFFRCHIVGRIWRHFSVGRATFSLAFGICEKYRSWQVWHNPEC